MLWRELVTVAALLVTGPAAAASTGVLLLHDRLETPAELAGLVRALDDAGDATAAPELCWSSNRAYDKALPDCLKEVDAAMTGLRAKGGSVVIAGVGGGALLAIDYAVSHPEVAGVIAIAPVGDPPDPARYPDFAAALKQAQAAVKSRKGNQPASFVDLAHGQPVTITATPAAFLSFHDAKSLVATVRSVKAKLLPKLKAPLLWIAGTRDMSQASTRAVFAAAPNNKLSAYERVDADHAGTADAAAAPVIAWLKTLE
jgi:pimeloyl-ACP methyl ester carboxylesterase